MLIRQLTSIFSVTPPVYAKPPDTAGQAVNGQTSSSSPSGYAGSSGPSVRTQPVSPSAREGSEYPLIKQPTQPPPPPARPQIGPPPVATEVSSGTQCPDLQLISSSYRAINPSRLHHPIHFHNNVYLNLRLLHQDSTIPSHQHPIRLPSHRDLPICRQGPALALRVQARPLDQCCHNDRSSLNRVVATIEARQYL